MSSVRVMATVSVERRMSHDAEGAVDRGVFKVSPAKDVDLRMEWKEETISMEADGMMAIAREGCDGAKVVRWRRGEEECVDGMERGLL